MPGKNDFVKIGNFVKESTQLDINQAMGPIYNLFLIHGGKTLHGSLEKKFGSKSRPHGRNQV